MILRHILSNKTIQIIKYADTNEVAINNLTRRQLGFYIFNKRHRIIQPYTTQ